MDTETAATTPFKDEKPRLCQVPSNDTENMKVTEGTDTTIVRHILKVAHPLQINFLQIEINLLKLFSKRYFR